QAALGYAVPVCLRTVEELERVVSLDPFKGVAVTPDVRLSVTFLAEPAAVALPVPSRTPKGDYELVGKTDAELFVVWHLVNGRPATRAGGGAPAPARRPRPRRGCSGRATPAGARPPARHSRGTPGRAPPATRRRARDPCPPAAAPPRAGRPA